MKYAGPLIHGDEKVKKAYRIYSLSVACRNGLKLSALISISALVIACGSGGSDDNTDTGGNNSGNSGSGGGSNTSSRLARIRYDFDNNGVFEGLREFTYDSSGRVSMERYTYNDDGTTDVDLKSFTLANSLVNSDTVPESTDYSYTADGLLEAEVISGPSGRETTNYAYRSDKLVGSVHTVKEDNTGAVTADISTALTYTDTRLDSFSINIAGQSEPFLRYDFNYGGTGLLDYVIQTMSSGIQVQQNFSWRADGKIDLITFELLNSQAGIILTVDYEYDSAGKLLARKSISDDPDEQYQWLFSYDSSNRMTGMEVDLGSDGSVEAQLSMEWESGPCLPVIAWTEGGEPNFKADPNSLYLAGTGYVRIDNCE